MANSKQEKHNVFFDEQKSMCGVHTFPSNGDDTLTTQSIMIPKQDDAQRIHNDKEMMNMMYADGFVWNPTLNKNGVMKFKFSRQISIDYKHHFENDPTASTMIHYKKGLFIDKNIDASNKYEPLLGLIKTTKASIKALTLLDKQCEKLAKAQNMTIEEARKILA